MTQEEFENLSKKEVKQLNAQDDKEMVLESWRAGYIHLQEKLRNLFETEYNSEFLSKVEEIVYDELDNFKNK